MKKYTKYLLLTRAPSFFVRKLPAVDAYRMRKYTPRITRNGVIFRINNKKKKTNHETNPLYLINLSIDKINFIYKLYKTFTAIVSWKRKISLTNIQKSCSEASLFFLFSFSLFILFVGNWLIRP